MLILFAWINAFGEKHNRNDSLGYHREYSCNGHVLFLWNTIVVVIIIDVTAALTVGIFIH